MDIIKADNGKFVIFASDRELRQMRKNNRAWKRREYNKESGYKTISTWVSGEEAFCAAKAATWSGKTISQLIYEAVGLYLYRQIYSETEADAGKAWKEVLEAILG